MTITINSIALFIFLQIFFYYVWVPKPQWDFNSQETLLILEERAILDPTWVTLNRQLNVPVSLYSLSLPQSLGTLTIDCNFWELKVSFLIYIPEFPAGNSWSLPSTGLLPAIILWLASSPSLPCFLHFLIRLFLEHFLKWPTHKYYS